MSSGNRPLSPHLQVYRPQLTSMLSILHRITGVALAVGTLLLVCWLYAAAASDVAFADLQVFFGSIIGRLLLFGWSFALFYHLCNGMRHLAWDTGWGFELPTAYMTGRIVVGAAIALTILAWVVAYIVMGGM
ncbi:MAG: succinate dehydrogenase, cytochrome b556 subunit [Alphaproteobacteria bacterium]|jgi:succinate dehydrogenase / fumarate reductase cytochrome b subunit